MSDERSLSRRNLLQSGIAAAATTMAFSDLLAGAAEGNALSFLPSEKAEPQKYPFGWIRWLMSGKIDPHAEMTVGIVHVDAHQSNPPHVHPNSAEVLHMLSGTCEHLVGDRWLTLKPGDTVRIPKGVPHRARTGDQPFEALIVYDTPTRQMVMVNARQK